MSREQTEGAAENATRKAVKHLFIKHPLQLVLLAVHPSCRETCACSTLHPEVTQLTPRPSAHADLDRVTICFQKQDKAGHTLSLN